MAWQQKARYFGEECYPLAALSIAGHPVVQVLQQDSAVYIANGLGHKVREQGSV